MNDNETNPWKTHKSELVYESAWIAVTRHECLNPAGKPAVYSTVGFKHLAIGIIPLDNTLNTWLVGQWRYPLNQYSWEIVEGGGKHDTDPVASAKRELLEETGLKAEHYQELLRMHLSNSVSDELGIIYIATGLSQHTPEPEETEVLQVKKVHFSEAYNMVMDGRITDSLSVAAILKVKILLDSGELKV